MVTDEASTMAWDVDARGRLYHHEVGHAVVARALGMQVREVRVGELPPLALRAGAASYQVRLMTDRP